MSLLTSFIPASFTVKNGLIVLSKYLGDHENVKHKVEKYVLKIDVKRKIFDVLIFHPGTKDPTYLNDVFDNGKYYPSKYELAGHGHWYHFDQGGFMIGMIQSLVEKEVKTQDICDYVVVDYNDDATEIPCTVYLTKATGEKVRILHTIK